MTSASMRAAIVAGLALVGLTGAGLRGPAGTNAPGPGDPGATLHLVLNIPANRLDVYRGNELLESFPVSVGRAGHRTPAGSYQITHLIWNPWWRPPDRGWARGLRAQRPGWGNPMGRVKMFFSDLYYIHGTPNISQLGRPASHGCVRMANRDALKVARLVQEYGAPGTEDDVDRYVASTSLTRTVWLHRPVSFRVEYAVTEVRDGRLLIHPDVYGSEKGRMREQVMQTLIQNGYDPVTLDPARVDELLDRARRGGGLVVPLDSMRAQPRVLGVEVERS